MNREIRIIVCGLLAVIVTLLLAACTSRPQSVGSGGTAWGTGAFSSNGERIYLDRLPQNITLTVVASLK